MFNFSNPFAQIKRKQRENNIQFGGQGGNQGWGQQQNNGWEQQPNINNGWGQPMNNNNNFGWDQPNNNNNGWDQPNNNNGWNGNNNGWGLPNNNNNNNNPQNNPWQNLGFGNNLQGQQWVEQQKKRQQSQFMNIGTNDFNNYIEQQIVLIEPSPHQAVLEDLKKNGMTFKDTRFPPNQNSLNGQWGYLPEWKEVQWKAISEALPGAKIFQGKIQPGDIRQGYLGDCYFLAALAALAERPDRIYNLFLLNQVNAQKYYSVKLLYKGKWLTIDMDQYVPFLYAEPAFTKSNNKQLWVVLLQKAWAKLYSSYKRIEAGFPQEGLHDLTGAPIRNIYIKNSSFDKQAQWDYLLNRASPRDYAMVASSQPGSDTTKSVSGIVQGHAYTFLNAIILNFQGSQRRLVQLRNPWGKGESKGDWCDTDPNWNSVDPNEKKRIGFNPNKDDGIFFMSYDNFCKEFRALTVAEINDNASYVYKSFKDSQCKGCYFKVKVFEKSEQKYSFQVDHTPERSFEDKLQGSYQYPLTQIQVAKISGGSVGQKKGLTSNKRTAFYAQKLTMGEYLVYVKVHYDAKFEKDFDLNLAVYSEFATSVVLATAQEADMFAGRNVDWSGQQTKTNSEWNSLKSYSPANHNQGFGGNQWGNQQQPQNNLGWGEQQQNNNGGWGNNQSNNNMGYSDNNGWDNNQGNNSGWGNNPNNGWENNSGNNPPNNGW